MTHAINSNTQTTSIEDKENSTMHDIDTTSTTIADEGQLEPNLIAKRVISRERENREALQILLDDEIAGAGSGKLSVLTAKMADTTSFVASVTLKWIGSEIGFAKNLPLFKNKLNEHGELVIDEKTIDEIVQRPLDYTRQLPLTIYLAGRNHHKFPVLLVVLTADWVDDPYHDNWERDGNDASKWRAKRDVTEFIPLDGSGAFGLLDIEDMYLFALDGQHRLLGIQGLLHLIKNSRIARLKRSGEPTSVTYTLDELAETYGFGTNGIERLQHERIGIEIIPAIKRGETREEARRRVKSVFTHVNKHATVLTKGQLAQLDEDDGFSIVARGAAVAHPLLRTTPNREQNPRVNWQSSNIANRSTVLTTLQTLKEMADGYLGARSPYDHWKETDLKNLVPVRPDENQLEQGDEEFGAFLDRLAALPSMAELDRGATTRAYRLFTNEEVSEGPPQVMGKGHMLFRPVGQIVLARAVGSLVAQGRSLEDLFAMLTECEKSGGFALDDVKNPWWGVLYEPAGKKIARGGEDLATDVLIYLMGGLTDQVAREKLRTRLAGERTIRDGSSDEDKPVDFDGSRVSASEFKLPKML